MKKFLLLVVGLGVVQFLFAQSNFKNRLSYGLEIGPEFSSVRGGGLSNQEKRTAINGGAYVQYDISRVLRVSVGTYYDPRGFETSFQSPYLPFDSVYIGYNSFYAYDMTYRADYLTLPVNITYLSGGEKFRFFVEGGVYFSLVLHTHKKGYRGFYLDPYDVEKYGDSTLVSGYHMMEFDSTANDFFNAADVGLHFAFGLLYQISNKLALTFKPGFNFGLSQIVSAPEVDMKWDRILKINLGVVYRFHPYVKPRQEYILQ